MYSYNPYYEEYLAHHGVKGQKWGIRRYQPYTKGQKGVFKGLKKEYKKEKKALKSEKRYYKSQGDKLATSNIKKELNNLDKAYKATVKEVTEKFNKENWETYKQKLVDTGSYKQVSQIKNELNPWQLNKAAERFEALNKFERANPALQDYGNKTYLDRTNDRLRRIQNLMKTSAGIGTAYLALKDVSRTSYNMDATDKDFKILSREASANDAAKRAQTLKDVPLNRLPKYTGFYDENYTPPKDNKGGKGKGKRNRH